MNSAMNKSTRKLDPVTGPLTREEFAELVRAPHGKAIEAIRKIDPLYGRGPGEKVRWRVECRGTLRGVAFVEACDQKEADKLADELDDAAVDWMDSGGGFDILSVELDDL